MNRDKGVLVVVSAPSGVGKSTILGRLRETREKLCFSVSATTRAPREGERNGVEYEFVSRERFDEMAANGEFLEHADYVENCYGTPRAPVEQKLSEGWDVYLDIEVRGAMQVRKNCPEALLIFVMPPSMEELKRRLEGRGTEAPEVVEKRLREAEREMAERDKYDFVVVNDEVDRAAAEISRLIDAHRERLLAAEA